MKFRPSSRHDPSSDAARAVAIGLLCLGLVGLATSASATADGRQHPSVGSGAAMAGPDLRPAPPPVPKSRQVDLNNASRAELMKLPGIGPAEADRIVEGRPYLTKAAVVTRGVLPMQTYDALHRRVYVGPMKGSTDAKVAKAAKTASRP